MQLLKITNFQVITVRVPASPVSSNGWRATLALKGTDDFVSDNLCEFGDVDYYIKGPRNRLVNIASDATFKEHILIDNASNTQIKNALLKSTQSTVANTYSGITVRGTSFNNTVNATFYKASGGVATSYLLSDSTNIQNGISQKNSYDINGDSTTFGTAMYNIFKAGNTFGSLVKTNENAKYDNTATPNVNGKGFIVATGGTTITGFTGGQTSQQLSLFLTAATTITYGSSLKYKGLSTKTYPSNTFLRFINYNGIWEQEGDADNIGSLPGRTAVANVNYTQLATDVVIAYTSLTAGKTVALIAIADKQTVMIKDEAGTAATDNITITPPSGKTIDGASSLVINTAYGFKRLYYQLSSGNYFTY